MNHPDFKTFPHPAFDDVAKSWNECYRDFRTEIRSVHRELRGKVEDAKRDWMRSIKVAGAEFATEEVGKLIYVCAQDPDTSEIVVVCAYTRVSAKGGEDSVFLRYHFWRFDQLKKDQLKKDQ